MFTAEMIAPCGLDCSLCQLAHDKNHPCGDVMEKESRYTSAYPLYESPISNIRLIRELGMEEFLKKQRSEWSCRECGGPVCVQTGICRDCGRKYRRTK